MTVSTIRDEEGFAALAPEWDALVRAMPRPSPFLLHGWLHAWWRHFGAGHELRVHVVYEHGRLVGALPLYVRRRFGVRVAGFLGDDAAALADILVAPDDGPSTAARLAAQAGDGADFVDVFGLPAGSRLASSSPADLTLIARAEAPVLELAGGWEAVYTERTSSKRRSLHRRRWRQLAELGEVTFEVARTAPELEAGLEDAFRLHDARWRDRPEASGFATPDGRRFHRAAIRALAPTGAPRIALLRVGGQAVACNYFFLVGDRMYFHELAFDPALSRWSPGQLTTLAAIEAAAAEGAQRVEFLGGGERYKLELADRLEPLHQAIGLAATARGRAAAAARVASVRAHLRLKQTPVRRLYYEGLAPARRVARVTRSATSSRRGTSAPGRRPARSP